MATTPTPVQKLEEKGVSIGPLVLLGSGLGLGVLTFLGVFLGVRAARTRK